ncbi:MAG: hypothetical protein JWR84_271 [Caulobacter sp.]|nr:hypothetical protein [Caulobacter sp.]
MRLIVALAASAALAAVAAPAAAAQFKECKAFRSGDGWAVKYVAYTGPDGKVADTVSTTTYQIVVPETKGGEYGVNYGQDMLGKQAKGVVILEYGKRPTAEALGKVALFAPAYFSAQQSMLAGLEGKAVPVLQHRLVLKAAAARTPLWSTDARVVRTPRAMDALQFENAAAVLGASDVEALGAGGLTDARKAAGVITQLAKGGRVEVQIMEEGKPVVVGGFDITPLLAKAATDGAAAAKAEAEADLRASKGQCVAG